jgi:hypothetical protein
MEEGSWPAASMVLRILFRYASTVPKKESKEIKLATEYSFTGASGKGNRHAARSVASGTATYESVEETTVAQRRLDFGSNSFGNPSR